MSSVWKIVGYILWIGSGILTFIFWLIAMSKWLGILGIILAFILAPGVIIFPLVFWLVEDVFPVFYFIVWGVGIIGLVITGVASKDD